MREPKSNAMMKISWLGVVDARIDVLTSKRVGLTCIRGENSKRNERAITLSFLFPCRGGDGQQSITPDQSCSVLKNDPVAHVQPLAIEQTVGVTTKSNRIADERIVVFYAEFEPSAFRQKKQLSGLLGREKKSRFPSSDIAFVTQQKV